MKTTAFASAAAWRRWLERHHSVASEILLRCRKAHAGGPGVGYREALDEALCYGWIDGVRRRIDDDGFSVRFTPRKRGSIWSAVNIRRAGELQAEGRMHPAGLAAFEQRIERRSRVYSYENRNVALSAAYGRRFRENPRAWAWFQAQPPWYRRTSVFWVMSAKREETRLRRLGTLLRCSAEGRTIPSLTRAPTRNRRAPAR